MEHKQRNLPLRIALYSHDAHGLGQIRRNLAIALALTQGETPPAILLISGTQLASAWPMPPNVEVLSLPALARDGHGNYQARSLRLALEEMLSLRGNAIQSALRLFAPDILIVDSAPAGLLGELRPTLNALRQQGKTRCVLGLGDEPDRAMLERFEWSCTESATLIDTYYGAIWVYTDPTLYDPIQAQTLAKALAVKTRFTGYLARTGATTQATHQSWRSSAVANLPTKRLALCMVGSGEAGGHLAHTFALANRLAGTTGVILTGPYMPEVSRRQLQRMADRQPHLKVLEFVTEPFPWLAAADLVVATGGYNTVYEILAHQKHALIVPAVKFGQEQLARAERLCAHHLVDMMHPNELTIKRLSEWLATENDNPPDPSRQLDLDGLARIPQFVNELNLEQNLQSPPVLYSAATRKENGDSFHHRYLSQG